jgi:predicted SprT family Zn-dependent metalloprotease
MEPEKMTTWCAQILSRLGLTALASRIQVRWNPRLRSTAGRAWPRHALIELNPLLLTVSPEETDRTLRHELAHLIAHERAGKKSINPHGPEWQLACAQLGIPGESPRHRLPLPRNQVARPFRYQCPGCATIIHRTRRISRPSACASCCKAFAGGSFDERFRLYRVK